MRKTLAVAALLSLAACASEPGSQSDLPVISLLPQFITGLPGDSLDFGVAGLEQAQIPPAYAAFNNTGPQVAAQHADQICTRGYQKLREDALPGDPVGFIEWRVRCNAYRPSL